MKSSMVLMAGLFGLTLAACANAGSGDSKADGKSSAKGDAGAPVEAAAAASCADDGPRLPVTGLCASRAVAYLNIAGGQPPEVPEGCEWVVQETPFEGKVLLYRAARCGKKTTRLSSANASGMTELSYESLAYGDPDDAAKGTVLARVAAAKNDSDTASLLNIARDAIDDPSERQKCTVRKAGIDVWPEDALVVDVSPAEAARAPRDEPRATCGPFGLNEDEASYWRVFQGHSWFFQLGQDALQIDPGSFTLMAKDAHGEWAAVQ